MQTGLPIVPLCITGTYNMLPRGHMLIRPAKETTDEESPYRCFCTCCLRTFLGGCRTAPIQNIELAPIAYTSEKNHSMDEVKKAIIRGGYD
ncbi:hypothetical protein ADUPG1_003561, partial [Aduncisulcus paluster]